MVDKVNRVVDNISRKVVDRVMKLPTRDYKHKEGTYRVTALRHKSGDVWMDETGGHAEVLTPDVWVGANRHLKELGLKLCVWVEDGSFLCLTEVGSSRKVVSRD